MKRGAMIPVGVLALLCLAPAIGRAAPPAAAGGGGLAAEVTRLQAEVREQRQLLMQLMRIEQEHYDLLLRMVQGGAAAEPGAGAGGGSGALKTPPAIDKDGADAAAHHAAVRTGSVRGKVQFPGGTLRDVYAYVENVKSPPARGRTVEIAQRDRQFVPEVMVVQRGTRVLFPNYDTVFHNVFSPTPPRPFDLGSYRAGETPKSVELTSPGVVEIFCNVHSKMRASVLVVPSSVYTPVAADGSFRLDGVPLGTRKLVIWGPHSKPVEQTVELGPAGADVSLALQPAGAAVHNNKFGQPYSSYKD
jgi:plastocyanin